MDSDDVPLTAIAVSNRQQVSGIAYDATHAAHIRFRIDLAVATAKGTAEALVTRLRTDRIALESAKPLPPNSAARAALPTAREVPALAAGASPGAPPGAPDPGWYPDVCKRFELRYWDGQEWTDHVSTAGVQACDPVG